MTICSEFLFHWRKLLSLVVDWDCFEFFFDFIILLFFNSIIFLLLSVRLFTVVLLIIVWINVFVDASCF